MPAERGWHPDRTNPSDRRIAFLGPPGGSYYPGNGWQDRPDGQASGQQAEEGDPLLPVFRFPLKTPALVSAGKRTGVRAARQQEWRGR
jgi:hypothetical protein